MPWTLRLRHAGGTATLVDIPDNATLKILQDRIQEETGVLPSRQSLKVAGVPPRLIPSESACSRLDTLGCGNRDTIILDACAEVSSAQLETPANTTGGIELPLEVESDDDYSEPLCHQRGRKRVGDVLADAPANARRPKSIVEGRKGDARESELLPAFDRAIAAAQKHVKMVPDDRHQVFALRKGKAAVSESLKQGNDISIGVLHTLRGVGHWVVQQVREHLEVDGARDSEVGAASGQQNAPKAQAPPPTPSNFTWTYVDRNGNDVADRNSAEFMGSAAGDQFRVKITHSSGRIEKAWLPDAKAPPRSPKI